MGYGIYSSSLGENEKADTSVEVLEDEIEDLCFVVEFNEFYSAFLKSASQEPIADDLKDCIDHLCQIEDLDCKYSGAGLTQSGNMDSNIKLDPLALKNARREPELYKVQAKLFTAITNYTQRKQGQDIDSEWPGAETPLSSAVDALSSQSSSPTFLHRRFVFCPSKATKSVLGEENQAKLKLDMAMVIAKPDTKIHHDRPFSLQPQFHWEDAILPIEAKYASTFGYDVASQVAAYVRMARVEQFDRKFVYALTISKDGCRVWRWDTSACYVSESLNMHTSPAEFIRLIWHFHTMSPEDFGFDNHFSNAGRVLAEEVEIFPTTLTIQGIAPNVAQDVPPVKDVVYGGSEVQKKDDKDGPKEEPYLLGEKLSRSHGLFGRNPIVWRARLLDEQRQADTEVVIKQNWQDVARESEASYPDQVNTIPQGVAHLRASQELDSTREWCNRLSRSQPAHHAFKTFCLTNPHPSTPSPVSQQAAGHLRLTAPVHRMLIRMVFSEVDRPLMNARDSQELLAALLDIVKAMEMLYEMGILHRDISIGNTLLNREQEPAPGNRGLIIDFGLAQRLPSSAKPTSSGAATHNHRVGTLPFMATDLINPHIGNTVNHEIYHDLESIFWVSLYVCLKKSAPHVKGGWIHHRIADLESPLPMRVYNSKMMILVHRHFFEFAGEFSKLLPTMKEFASMCYMSTDRYQPPSVRLSFESVQALLQNGLDALACTLPALPPVSPKHVLEPTATNSPPDVGAGIYLVN